MKLFCCIEHVERALDEIVYECEEAPILNELEKEEVCEYCEQRAVYIVANEFSDTKCE
ncbi:MAG: yyzF-like family protein [Bacillales bacterium]|jgi:CxxH/CxxC protein (TIGR04129 family)|nr:yyzF-like family protein [Bacillales bacterium]